MTDAIAIPLHKRVKMQADGDYTVNAVGPQNMPPASKPSKDATTDLVDGFIRDGWIAPENRDAELAYLFQCQMRAAQRELASMRENLSRRAYAQGWASRLLAYMEDNQ